MHKKKEEERKGELQRRREVRNDREKKKVGIKNQNKLKCAQSQTAEVTPNSLPFELSAQIAAVCAFQVWQIGQAIGGAQRRQWFGGSGRLGGLRVGMCTASCGGRV